MKKTIAIIIFSALVSSDVLAGLDELYFRGYKCTADCSDHIAGYDWAIENNLKDPSQCSGHSDSFIEGYISLFVKGSPENVVLVEFKKSKNFSLGCAGSTSYGGPCYQGYGGPLYDGYGGPLYDGYKGPLYDGYGGGCYDGYGGNCYDGYGGDINKCPILCRSKP